MSNSGGVRCVTPPPPLEGAGELHAHRALRALRPQDNGFRGLLLFSLGSRLAFLPLLSVKQPFYILVFGLDQELATK